MIVQGLVGGGRVMGLEASFLDSRRIRLGARQDNQGQTAKRFDAHMRRCP